MAYCFYDVIYISSAEWLDDDKKLILTLLHEACHVWQFRNKPFDIRRLTLKGRQALELEATLNAFVRSECSIAVMLQWERSISNNSLDERLLIKYGLNKKEYIKLLRKVYKK